MASIVACNADVLWRGPRTQAADAADPATGGTVSERRTRPNAVVRVTKRRGLGRVGEDPAVAHAPCGLIHVATARVGVK